MKELKFKYQEQHFDFCMQLLEIEREKVRGLRDVAYDRGASEEFDILDERLSFLEEAKRSLWI